MEPGTFFPVTLVTVIISGAATAFLQGGAFALAGTMPFKYTQALMSGQGLAGVTVSLLSIFTQLAEGSDDPKEPALIFFSVSIAVIVMCIIGLQVLFKQPIVEYYYERSMDSEKQAKFSRRITLLTPMEVTPLKYIFKKIPTPALSVLLIFLVTLGVFPSITSAIRMEDYSSNYAQNYFVGVYCFLGFNVGDLIGRTLAGWYQFPSLQNFKKV